MRKPLFISVLILSGIALSAFLFPEKASARFAGAPAAVTGSPGDNADCSSCHGGAAAAQLPGAISSDVPPTGYVHGAVYNFSAAVSGGLVHGFEVSPQTAAGAPVGTLINGSSGSKLISSGKYITHTSPAQGNKTWTFQWQAPATGSQAATFYAAFIVGNGNGTQAGDQCKLNTYTVHADGAIVTGIEALNAASKLAVYPNPATDALRLQTTLPLIKGNIYTLDGQHIRHLENTELETGRIGIQELLPGVYFLEASEENQVYMTKFIKL